VKSEISRGLFSICSCLLAALPFEYVDEHEDFNYDLDTAQSQAKYDARLLSQQMLSDAELQRQGASGGQDNALDADSSRAQGIAAGSDLEAASSAQENLEPHSRAASCFTNGHKYTHGQKVGWLEARSVTINWFSIKSSTLGQASICLVKFIQFYLIPVLFEWFNLI